MVGGLVWGVLYYTPRGLSVGRYVVVDFVEELFSGLALLLSELFRHPSAVREKTHFLLCLVPDKDGITTVLKNVIRPFCWIVK